jgi:hypothetical protein
LLSLFPESTVVSPKPKRLMLPVLVTLFALSYGLMTMLIVEQGKTIDSQRYLIRELFSDSTQLSAMKGNAVQKAQAEAKAHAQAGGLSSQAAAGNKAAAQAGKLQRPSLPKLPKDASDRADDRRSLLKL